MPSYNIVGKQKLSSLLTIYNIINTSMQHQIPSY